MVEIEFIKIIGVIATFISLLLAFFIFSTTSNNTFSNKLFGAYLILNAVEFSGFFASYIFNEPNNILVATRELSYLQMPVFYLYILSVCYSDFKIQWKHLWHITPYIIGNLVMLPRFYLGSTAQKVELYNNFNQLPESYFSHIALHLQSTLYIIAGFIVLKRAKKIFVQNYSSGTIATYSWLFQLLFFTAMLYAIAIVKNVFKFFGNPENATFAQNTIIVVVLCFVCWYVLKALKHPHLFSGVDSKTKLTALCCV